MGGEIEPASGLVVLDDPERRPGLYPICLAPEVAHLGLRFPALTMAVVRPRDSVIVRGRSRRVEGPVDRAALWRLVAGAAATLDLRPTRLLAREVLESLLLSTPVVVPATSGSARRHVQDANGGLWYRSPEELAACVQRVRSADLRSALGAQGRRWAAATHGDEESFVRATRLAVLGGSAPTGAGLRAPEQESRDRDHE